MIVSAAAAVLLLAPAGTTTMAKNRSEMAVANMEEVVRRYSVDRRSLQDFYFVDFSDTRLRRIEQFARDWQEKLKAIDFDALDRSGKVDYILLRNEVDYRIKEAGFQRRKNLQTTELTPFAKRVVALEETRWKVETVDPQKTAGELDLLVKEIREERKQIQTELDKKKDGRPPSAELAFRSSKTTKELSDTLERWFKHYDGFKPLFSWWNRKPYETAKKELDEYTKFLKETIAGIKDADDDPLIGDPIGQDELLADLEHEMIPYTPEELVKIAEREYAWCEAEMKKASNQMGFKNDWKKALEKVKSLHVQPGEQDDLVADQAKEAIAFLDKHELVTIEPLCRETWRVDMLDAKGQRVLPFAAYGGQKMLVAFPLDTMDHETKLMSLRGNNVHFTRAITHHELIPGHHLQGYMAQRYRPYRQVFSTPFFGEGWALHWEMLLWDLDFPRGPEDRVGMLFWRMHRAARIIVSLNFHLGKMKPQQMIDFLVDKVGHERWTATSEVRRFIGGAYSPLYQCAYMIGGLQLRALYTDLVGSGKMSPKQFHDAVLKENSIPLEMMRAALTDVKLTRNYKAGWKFD